MDKDKIQQVTLPLTLRVSRSELKRSITTYLPLKLLIRATRKTVSNYAADLLSNLGIPAKIEVQIEFLDEGVLPSEIPFALIIGDKAARLDLRSDRRPLHEMFQHEIYRNRALLVTEDTAKAVATALNKNHITFSNSLVRIQGLLCAYVQRNISLAAFNQVLTTTDLSVHDTNWALPTEIHREERLGVSIELHPESFRALQFPGDGEDQSVKEMETKEKLFQNVQTEFLKKFGFLCPLPELSWSSELAKDEYRIRINDVRLPVRRMNKGENNMTQILSTLRKELLDVPQAFLTRESIDRSLNILRETSPVLVDEILRRFKIDVIYCILDSMVEEKLSIQSLGQILNALTFLRGRFQVDMYEYIVFTPHTEMPIWMDNQAKTQKLQLDDYVCAVRANLKQEISHRYSKNSNTEIHSTPKLQYHTPNLIVYLLDRSLEKRIQESNNNPFDEREREELVLKLIKQLKSGPVIILTSYELRKPLWRLIHYELPDVTVLSYQELTPDSNITPVARIL